MYACIAAVMLIIAAVGGWYAYAKSEKESIPSKDMYVAGNLLLGTDGTSTNSAYLIGFNGMALYTYAKDTSGTSSCTGSCVKEWIPYLVPSKDILANVQEGIPGAVGSITRASGMQVMYEGKPLYFYTGDSISGDINGQGKGGSIVQIPAITGS
jgi:predicted lipoprotein with Yx(FWY)xxD motif